MVSRPTLRSRLATAPKTASGQAHFIRVGQLLVNSLDVSWCPTGAHGKLVSQWEATEYHTVCAKYLEAPAAIIGIPATAACEFVVQTMWNTIPLGDPESSWHIFYRHSIEKFAQRVIIDRDVLIPALVPIEMRGIFLESHMKFQRLFFDRLDTIEDFMYTAKGLRDWDRPKTPLQITRRGNPFGRLISEWAISPKWLNELQKWFHEAPTTNNKDAP